MSGHCQRIEQVLGKDKARDDVLKRSCTVEVKLDLLLRLLLLAR